MSKKFLVLALILTGCADGGAQAGAPEESDMLQHVWPTPASGSETIEGVVLTPEPVHGAQVCAYAFTAATGTNPLECTITDIEGNWRLPTRHLTNDVRLEARADSLQYPLSAVLSHVDSEAPLPNVAITPLTHLVSGYAEYLASNAMPIEDAVAKSKNDMHQYFAGHDISAAKAWHPDAIYCAQSQAARFTHFFIAALSQLATEYNDKIRADAELKAGLESLVQGLYQDIKADGKFDGRGAGEAAISAVGVPLTGQTLRGDFIVAIQRYIEGGAVATGLGYQDLAPFVAHTMFGQQDIFGGPILAEGPKLFGCEVIQSGRKVTSLANAQRGTFDVRCYWQNPGDIATTHITVEDKYKDAFTALEESASEASFRIDSAAISAANAQTQVGPTTVAFVLEAADTSDNKQTFRKTFIADNSQLHLTHIKHAKWIGPNTDATVTGEAEYPVRRVTLGAAGRQQSQKLYTQNESSSHFEISHHVPCGAAYKLRLVVEDWFGAQAERDIEVTCDNTAPVVLLKPSEFRDDADNSNIRLDAKHNHLPNLRKYFNRLDYLPEHGLTVQAQNLPVLVFAVDDLASSPAGAPSECLDVFYRYTQVGTENPGRDWGRIRPDSEGLYHLPFSYQTLLPQTILDLPTEQGAARNFIGRSSTDTVHAVEIQVVDLAGNASVERFEFNLSILSPAVRVTSCGATAKLLHSGLTAQSMSEVRAVGTALYSGSVKFETNLIGESLAPRGTVALALEDGLSLQNVVYEARKTFSEVPASALPDDKRKIAESIVFRDDIPGQPKNPDKWAIQLGLSSPSLEVPDNPITGGLMFAAKYSPEASYSLLSGVVDDEERHQRQSFAEGPVTLRQDAPFTVSSLVADSTLPSVKDAAISFDKPVTTPFPGHPMIVDTRAAVQIARSTSWHPVYFLEYTSLEKMHVNHNPARLKVVGTTEGIPVPQVEMDASCMKTICVGFDIYNNWGALMDCQ